MSNSLIYKYFDDDDFLRISRAIKENELKTSGEIKVSIKEKIPFLKRNKSIRELAEEEFFKLGMGNTRDKTGILLFFDLMNKRFYILADEGINSKVEQITWDEIRNKILDDFKKGNYASGIIAGINSVGEVLSKYFPIKPDDTNELSNSVSF